MEREAAGQGGRASAAVYRDVQAGVTAYADRLGKLAAKVEAGAADYDAANGAAYAALKGAAAGARAAHAEAYKAVRAAAQSEFGAAAGQADWGQLKAAFNDSFTGIRDAAQEMVDHVGDGALHRAATGKLPKATKTAIAAGRDELNAQAAAGADRIGAAVKELWHGLRSAEARAAQENAPGE